MPAPNSFAITDSRSRPVTRLMNTATETTPAERTTLSDAVGGLASTRPASSLAVLFKEVGNRHDAGVVVRQLVFFIGRMQSIVGQAETHQDGRNAQVLGEITNDRDGAAATN